MRKVLLALIAGILGTAIGILAPMNVFAQQLKMPEPWQAGGKPPWPKTDWMEGTAKRLQKGQDYQPAVLRLKRCRPKPPICWNSSGRATTSSSPSGFCRQRLLSAADEFLSCKADRAPQEQDLGRRICSARVHFRVRQAGYFAKMSGEKNADQYVTLARSLYQQGRSSYDAHEYQRARLLGDASSFIVFALECMAQAATPDPHIYK
jgi:hypothetical protein